VGGPTTSEGVIMEELRREARAELEAKANPRFPLDNIFEIGEEAEALAKSRLKKAMAEAGLALQPSH